MIYSYTPVKTSGPFGSLVTFNSLDDEEQLSVTNIAEIDGKTYIFIPDDQINNIPDQPEEINFTQEEITKELSDKIKQSRFVQNRKDRVRRTIEVEVGDLYDLLADTMKLIEYDMVLGAKVAREMLGGEPISQEDKDLYLQRINSFIPLVEDQSITTRGSFKDVSTDIQRVLTRYSKLQEIVKTQYVDDLSQYGL